ncbi:MAG: sigma-70 family RNA polymerase sigma factor [Terriglobales bacterium]
MGATATVADRSDLGLVRRALDGDGDAFASLFHLHKHRVYAVILRMTKNTAEADDLTQDAFIQVFRKLSTFRGESALSTWLHRIAVTTALMHFRRQAPRQVSLDEPGDQDALSLPKREYGRHDDQLRSSLDRIALARALESLPHGYRTIFELHEIKGYGHREIASLLQCSIGNSKSQLHKAKERMRECLSLKRQPTRPLRNSRRRRGVMHGKNASMASDLSRPCPGQAVRRDMTDPDSRATPTILVLGTSTQRLASRAV